jgi:hypothetical protein
LVVELAAGASLSEAAHAAGLSERTARRRVSEPAFQARLADARDEVVGQTLATLVIDTTLAAQTLVELMSKTAPAPLRLRAALGLLDQAARYRDRADLEDRLAAVEALLEQDSGHADPPHTA